ncbi:seminal fluid protein HACP044 [Danaus plexippus plexippus]|uniref:Seminal fluid protein HACP044 n=1 Tax=Danaus plexippus plexippus TaxID=278856 RepID=A0A212FD86_DANPL|nr:seminal fluid protein HACP044 [Danaus plexippus plexippus]
MKFVHFIVVSAFIVGCSSQRSPYAGLRPIGFPVVEATTLASTLGNRFGETTTTQRLPLEALGDRGLVNRLGQLPQDKQPFWFLNWSALEENRKKPQTYPQRPNTFSESIFREMADISFRSNANQNTGSQNNANLNNINLQEATTTSMDINSQNPKVLSKNNSGNTISASPQAQSFGNSPAGR